MTEHLSHPKYRPDIDGLRAMAVLSVVAFHAFPSSVKGGFIGVDVFFVISGFLISTIIFENLEKGTFSFGEFYSRRIRRIFPALLLVLTVSLVLGWFTLLTDELKQLGKHIAGGAGFVSNFVLLKEAGYFDNASETKPLLHLWSLGIEEQFYIAYPLLLWLAWKHKFNLLTIIVIVAVASFVLNIKGVNSDLTATFYSPQTRFWELMFGGILAWGTLYKSKWLLNLKDRLDRWLTIGLYRKPREFDGKTLSNVISIFGLTLLLYGFFRIEKGFSFPGKWALVPVLGTVLIILAGQQAWVNRTILSNRLAVWFGLISFPLYLWHWLFLSIARVVESETPTREIRIACVGLSVCFAWITCKYIEHPLRTGGKNGIKVLILVLLMFVVLAIGLLVKKYDGFPSREVVKVNFAISSGSDGGDLGLTVPKCGLESDSTDKLSGVCAEDKRGNIRFALVGDSKAIALFGGLVRTSQDNGRWLFIRGKVANGALVPMISMPELLAKINEIEVVVIATAIRAIFSISDGVNGGNFKEYDYKYLKKLNSTNEYNSALSGTNAFVSLLVNAGKKVILVVDNPALPNPEDCITRKTLISFVNQFITDKKNNDCQVSLQTFNEQIKIYRKLLNEISTHHLGKVFIFDPTDVYCDISNGVCESSRNGRLMYSYTDHISDYAAGLVGFKLNSLLNHEIYSNHSKAKIEVKGN